jgi:hypothetical protein
MRGMLVLLVCALAAAPGPRIAPADAAPIISIRARTDAQLRAVRRRDDGMIAVTGALVDRASTQGIGGLDVAVTVAGTRHDVITSPDGRFDVLAAPSPGPVDVMINFAGDDRFDPASLV